MVSSQKFENVYAWREAHQLALYIYKITRVFPEDERFGLTNQLRRAAVSVPSNIAEGYNRLSLKEKIHFYGIAIGSVSEVQSQLILARDLEYITQEQHQQSYIMTETTHKLLSALIKSLRAK